MKKTRTNKTRILSIVLSLLMVLSIISIPSFKVNAEGGVDGFVERCYTVTLDRGSDPDGFADWKNQLLTGKSVGVNIAYGFLFSAEYKNKNKSDEDYVTDLYKLFMDREPDEGGFNDWTGKLKNGATKEEVFAGFANSQEFYNICESYGITAGSFAIGYDRNQVNNVNLFVERLYQTCLGRRGDRNGQKDWVNKLLKKEITGIECARCFIQSKEYVNKGLSDEDYVENMYKAMMGRASDPAGKETWLAALGNGKTRDEVFAGFANSKEFGDICAAYKIEKGSYTAKDIGNYKDPNANEIGNVSFEDLEKYGFKCVGGYEDYLEYENKNGALIYFPDDVYNLAEEGDSSPAGAWEHFLDLLDARDHEGEEGYFYDSALRNDISSEWEYGCIGTGGPWGNEIYLLAFSKSSEDVVKLICIPSEDNYEEDLKDFRSLVKYFHVIK